MPDAGWIELDGAVNVRDLGGLPTLDGGAVLADRLIRADNLQGLTGRDVRLLVDGRGVRSVADLRTPLEIGMEGPGPMAKEPLVRIVNYSLFPESGQATDAAADTVADGQDEPVLLPWQEPDRPEQQQPDLRGAAEVYLSYLNDRHDSVVGALRLVAASPGATIVHCAAGKDRTGVVVATALAEVGVVADAIVEDYARSAERIERIFGRLSASRTYAHDMAGSSPDQHAPRATTMRGLLAMMDDLYGGAALWLRRYGWTEDDAASLRRSLLG